MQETGLVKYDAMMHAIAECCRIDEVKDLRDKAYALQLYAQQAKNTEAENRAAEIRIRAERKTGQLLIDGGCRDHRGGDRKSMSRNTTLKTLDEIGISRDQSSRWQKLTDIPDKKFESYLAVADKPSTAGAIKLAPNKPKKRKKAARPNTASRSNSNASHYAATEESEDEHAHRLELSQACHVLAGAQISKTELIERMPPNARKRLQDVINKAQRWLQ